MSRIALKQRLQQDVFFVDGAMGTQLFERGAPAGGCNEWLAIDRPAIVLDVHRTYLAAGSHAVLTNTFGGNAISLKRHGLEQHVGKINLAAAQVARQAAGESNYVLGDIGPCGDFLEPLGMLKVSELLEAMAAQAQALDEGGVDGFIIETMTAIEEVIVAVQAVRRVSSKPVLVSMSFDPAGAEARTMMGISPSQMIEPLCELGVDAVGYNCGTLDMAGYVELAKAFAAAAAGRMLLLAEPNAGKPELIDGKAVYTLSPAEFAESAVQINAAGAAILGGCCGTTPAHIAAAVKAISAKR